MYAVLAPHVRTNVMNNDAAQSDQRTWYHLHASTWIVSILALAALVVWNASAFGFVEHYLPDSWQRGWPVPFSITLVDSSWVTHHTFRPLAFAADVAMAVVAAAVFAALVECRRRRRRNLLSFNLRDMFAVALAVAAVLGYWRHLVAKQRDVDEFIKSQGGSDSVMGVRQGLPMWLRRRLPRGDLKLGDTVTAVNMHFLWGELDLMWLSKLTGLRALWLGDAGTTMEIDTQAHYLSELRKLERLHIEHTNMTDAGLERLRGLRRLKELQLNDRITDAGLVHLLGMTRLESLTLHCPRITDTGVAQLSKLRRLKTLELDEANQITDGGLAHLKSLAQLESLVLKSSQLSDSGLIELSGLSSLRRLSIPDCQVTGSGLVHLRTLPKLEVLDLSGNRILDRELANLANFPSLSVLNLSQTRISDAGIPLLAPVKKLKILIVRSTALTDQSLKTLAEFPALHELIIADSQFTEAGVAELRRARPPPGLLISN
ncbi:MAG: hypothetical protein WD669_02805 [Pirellulales bacterium]